MTWNKHRHFTQVSRHLLICFSIFPHPYSSPSLTSCFTAEWLFSITWSLLSAILLYSCTRCRGCNYILKVRRATWFMMERHKFPLNSTMDSKKRTGWVFHSSKHSWPKARSLGCFFCIRLAIQLSPCSAGSEKEILHTSAVDLDARVEDTNPQGGGVFIYPVLQ